MARFSKYGNHKITKKFISLMDSIDKASKNELQDSMREFGDWDCSDETEYQIVDLLYEYTFFTNLTRG